jgi:hypothetical protein
MAKGARGWVDERTAEEVARLVSRAGIAPCVSSRPTHWWDLLLRRNELLGWGCAQVLENSFAPDHSWLSGLRRDGVLYGARVQRRHEYGVKQRGDEAWEQQ